jgi:hypothetical protein
VSAGERVSAGFPRILIRYQACVYGSLPVFFIDRGSPPSSALRGVWVEVHGGAGAESTEQRRAFVALLLALAARTGWRMCAVFGPNDCVYVEPDGTIRASSEGPSGGVAW